jgi:hypothetical protein
MATSHGQESLPVTDETLRLPSGASARVRGIFVFRVNAGSTLTLMVQASKPASGDPRAASEAQELANLHDEFARRERVDRIAISICETAEAIETSAPPAVIFYFRRVADGSWSADGTVEYPLNSTKADQTDIDSVPDG